VKITAAPMRQQSTSLPASSYFPFFVKIVFPYLATVIVMEELPAE
jgi:hypothetical protein